MIDEINFPNTFNEFVNQFTRADSSARLYMGVELVPIKPGEDIHRRKGKWIKRGKIFQCSECEKFSITQDNYCSNCGADMRDENDNIPMEYFENGGV